jgi:hypothetical protein
MKRRITAIVIMAVMVLSAIGINPAKAEAAATPFMTVEWESPIKEKR